MSDSKFLLFRKQAYAFILAAQQCLRTLLLAVLCVFFVQFHLAAVIYYIGHGKKGTGDWCFKDGFITFIDIIHLYNTTKIHGRVLAIVSNCSHSGSWVQECSLYLDEQGVRACGHSSIEKGILLKVYASCRRGEVANSLIFPVKCMMNDKNSRILSFWTAKELQTLQHSFGLNFTVLRCGKAPQDSCSLTSPEYTWIKRCQGLWRLFLVRGADRGRPAWHYVLLVDDEEMARAFKTKTQGDSAGTLTIDVSDYGQVLKSGFGKDPPNEIRDEMEKQYNDVYG